LKIVSFMRKNRLRKDILNEFGENAQKLRGDFPPLSIKENDQILTMKIKNIYRLDDLSNRIILINVYNYDGPPKYLNFLSIIATSQSSDLIVELSKDLAIEMHFNLVQYPIFQGNYRVSLLALRRLTKLDEINTLIPKLNQFKKDLQRRLKKVKELVMK
jgi:hypothetical protein